MDIGVSSREMRRSGAKSRLRIHVEAHEAVEDPVAGLLLVAAVLGRRRASVPVAIVVGSGVQQRLGCRHVMAVL
jgi:hypothetical protein